MTVNLKNSNVLSLWNDPTGAGSEHLWEVWEHRGRTRVSGKLRLSWSFIDVFHQLGTFLWTWRTCRMHSRSMACMVLILPCLLHSRILKIMPTKATKPTMKCLKQWILKMKIEQRPCEVWETGQTVGYWAGICCDAESLQRNWWGPVTGQLCSYSIDDLLVACCVCARIAQEASQFRSCKKPWCIILLAMLLSLSSKSKGVEEYGSQLTTMNPTCYPKLLRFRFLHLGGGKCRSSNRVFSPKKLTISPCVETGCLSAYPFLQELTAESLWNISKGFCSHI